jgi:hypothetical protein
VRPIERLSALVQSPVLTAVGNWALSARVGCCLDCRGKPRPAAAPPSRISAGAISSNMCVAEESARTHSHNRLGRRVREGGATRGRQSAGVCVCAGVMQRPASGRAAPWVFRHRGDKRGAAPAAARARSIAPGGGEGCRGSRQCPAMVCAMQNERKGGGDEGLALGARRTMARCPKGCVGRLKIRTLGISNIKKNFRVVLCPCPNIRVPYFRTRRPCLDGACTVPLLFVSSMAVPPHPRPSSTARTIKDHAAHVRERRGCQLPYIHLLS